MFDPCTIQKLSPYHVTGEAGGGAGNGTPPGFLLS